MEDKGFLWRAGINKNLPPNTSLKWNRSHSVWEWNSRSTMSREGSCRRNLVPYLGKLAQVYPRSRWLWVASPESKCLRHACRWRQDACRWRQDHLKWVLSINFYPFDSILSAIDAPWCASYKNISYVHGHDQYYSRTHHKTSIAWSPMTAAWPLK